MMSNAKTTYVVSCAAPVSPSLAVRDAVLFIQECGLKLECREITIATACTIFHRTQTILRTSKAVERESADSALARDPASLPGEVASVLDDLQIVATSCIILAGKIEENHMNVRKVINVAYNTAFRERELNNIDDYYAVRKSLMLLELWLLRLMGFQMNFDHPHKYMMCFLKALDDWLPRETMQRYPVVTVCWSVLRDSYLTPLAVEEKPQHIATAVIAFTLHLLGISVPGVEVSERSWFQAFCRDLRGSHLDRIVQSLIAVYEDRSTQHARKT